MSCCSASTGQFGPCALCGVGRLEEIVLEIVQPDRFERAAGIREAECHRAWIRCGHCGALTNVRLDGREAVISAIAESYYAIDYAGESLESRFRHILELADGKSDNRQRVQRVKAYTENWFGEASIPGALYLLDIGAGLGVFLHAFLDNNTRWHGWALEPDPTAAKHLRNVAPGRFTILEATLEDLQHGQSVYQLCTLNKVLEHIADPYTFLRQVASLIDRCRGLLYVEVPDYWTVGNRDNSDNILGALHCHLYGIRSISMLLQRVGLIPLKVERLREPSGKISIYAFAAHPDAIRNFVNDIYSDRLDALKELCS